MNTQTAEKALHDPLPTDTAIEDRALRLIGTARSRQLWLMMLDDADNQIPVVVPLDDLPLLPDRIETDLLVGRLSGMLSLAGASQAVLVWERPGRGRLTESDTAWVRALAEHCSRRGVRLRAQLLSHTGGVTLIAPGDYEEPARSGRDPVKTPAATGLRPPDERADAFAEVGLTPAGASSTA